MRIPYSRIALVGMMGVGKTTVGRRLAELLRWSFIDTDALVEERAGQKISEIFQTRGEEAFRELERAAVISALKEEDAVIALGGGAVAYRDNISLLKQRALVVWLRAEVADLVRRLHRDQTRPLLQGVDPAVRLGELLERRKDYYAQAHVHIDTTQRGLEEICSEIIDYLMGLSGGRELDAGTGDGGPRGTELRHSDW